MKIAQSDYMPEYTPKILREKIERNPLLVNTLKASAARAEKTAPRHWITDIVELSLGANRLTDIAERIARGMAVTPEEREYLRQKNPELLMHADNASQMRTRLSGRISRCKTREEARRAVDAETQIAIAASGFSRNPPRAANPDAYKLYSAAINEAKKAISSRSFSGEDER